MEQGAKAACRTDSAELEQPETKPNSKGHENAAELRAAVFVRGRQGLLLLGQVGLDYSMVLLLGRTPLGSWHIQTPDW